MATALRQGLIGGLIAGIVYTVYAQAVTVITAGTSAFIMPFRQIAAVALGPSALSPGADATTAVLVGTAVHLALSVIFGIAIAVVLRAAGLRSTAAIIGGAVMGLAIYALNIFAIFPAAFPWFLENDRVIQSFGHALFGAIVGAWVRR